MIFRGLWGQSYGKFWNNRRENYGKYSDEGAGARFCRERGIAESKKSVTLQIVGLAPGPVLRAKAKFIIISTKYQEK